MACDTAARGSLISERPPRVICACRGPGGPPLIIACTQEGDDVEEAAGDEVCVCLAGSISRAGVYRCGASCTSSRRFHSESEFIAFHEPKASCSMLTAP